MEVLIEDSIPFSVFPPHIFLFPVEPLWNRYLEQYFLLFFLQDPVVQKTVILTLG